MPYKDYTPDQINKALEVHKSILVMREAKVADAEINKICILYKTELNIYDDLWLEVYKIDGHGRERDLSLDRGILEKMIVNKKELVPLVTTLIATFNKLPLHKIPFLVYLATKEKHTGFIPFYTSSDFGMVRDISDILQRLSKYPAGSVHKEYLTQQNKK